MTQREALIAWYDSGAENREEFIALIDAAQAQAAAPDSENLAKTQALLDGALKLIEISNKRQDRDKRLAKAAVEPVAWMTKLGDVTCFDQVRPKSVNSVPLYTSPTAQTAVEPCFMCHGKGEHQMASAWLPGQPEIKPVMVKCQQCKPKAAVEPVAYWIPKAEQFCFASPTGRPFAKAWEPLYAMPPSHTKAMRLALEALIDAFYQLNTFPRSEEHQRVMTDCDAAIAALEESLKCQ